ncbi:MAG: beta-lactamase family protein [Clostridia bacterium]|nr:beta-lactamase family protein [Clostridia bacterium]
MNDNMQKLLVSLLEEGVKKGCFPGGVAAVGCGDELLAVGCAGKLCVDGPDVNLDTRYDMASLSKVLGPTMVALKMIENGQLALYDTIGDFIPDAPEDKKNITIIQLMTHTAGFNPAFWLENLCQTPADVLKVLMEKPLDYKPGTDVAYSCMGYITLAKVLETIGGKPLNELAQEMVFGPLGMAGTGYCPTGDNIAATEVNPETGKAWVGIVHDENARFQGGVSGNAGVFSNIGDMIKFCTMLACGGKDYLTSAMLAKAIRCYTPGKDVHRGLGFHLAGTECNYLGDLMPDCSFGHTGFTGTSCGVDPTTGYYVILLTNRVHPTRDNLSQAPFRRRFHNAMYAQFCREK